MKEQIYNDFVVVFFFLTNGRYFEMMDQLRPRYVPPPASSASPAATAQLLMVHSLIFFFLLMVHMLIFFFHFSCFISPSNLFMSWIKALLFLPYLWSTRFAFFFPFLVVLTVRPLSMLF